MIELLLVVAIGVIIFLFSAPYGLDFYRTQLLNEAQSNIIGSLERARHNAVLQKNDSNFGVYLIPGSFTIFETPTLLYADRVMANDEVYSLPTDVNLATTTIVFSKLTGLPSATGTIALTFNDLTRGVLIDDAGVVSKAD